MFGLVGIFTEILRDISFRGAPVEKRDAMEMMHEIRAHRILSEIRGLPAADLHSEANVLSSTQLQNLLDLRVQKWFTPRQLDTFESQGFCLFNDRPKEARIQRWMGASLALVLGRDPAVTTPQVATFR